MFLYQLHRQTISFISTNIMRMTRDTYIKLLNEQSKQDSNLPFTKVNIHIALHGDIARYCIDLNKRVQLITPSQVDFGPNSFQIPHLTIEMGYIKGDEEFKNLMNEFYSFSCELSSFEVAPQKPYIFYPKRNYVFVDIGKNELILDIKRKAKERFKNWIIPLDWDVSKGTSHITIGYITDKFNEVEQMIEEYSIVPKWIANIMEISYTGTKGSCIGTIRSFEFGK